MISPYEATFAAYVYCIALFTTSVFLVAQMRPLRFMTRVAVGLTGALALGAAASVLQDPLYPTRVLYTHTTSLSGPRSTAALIGRLYATWLLTSGSVRIVAAVRYGSVACRLLAALTYVIALAHFYTEVFWFGTLSLHPAGRLPIIVASCCLGLLFLDAVSTVILQMRGGKHHPEKSGPGRGTARSQRPRRLDD